MVTQLEIETDDASNVDDIVQRHMNPPHRYTEVKYANARSQVPTDQFDLRIGAVEDHERWELPRRSGDAPTRRRSVRPSMSRLHTSGIHQPFSSRIITHP